MRIGYLRLRNGYGEAVWIERRKSQIPEMPEFLGTARGLTIEAMLWSDGVVRWTGKMGGRATKKGRT